MFRKSIAQQMLALKIGQPSLIPALHSSSQAAAASSAAVAAVPIQDNRFGIESNGHTRASQWDPAPPSAQAQVKIGEWWGKRLNAHIKYHTKREKQELAARQVRDRDEVFLDPQPNTANEGDLRLNKLQWWLNNLGVQRSPDQALFHKHFIEACLPKIYGASWNESSIRVMNMMGIKRIRAEVTAITPRRVSSQCHAFQRQTMLCQTFLILYRLLVKTKSGGRHGAWPYLC